MSECPHRWQPAQPHNPASDERCALCGAQTWPCPDCRQAFSSEDARRGHAQDGAGCPGAQHSRGGASAASAARPPRLSAAQLASFEIAGPLELLPASTFVAEWDEEGVFFYQNYNDDIADFALAHQRLGGPAFNPSRMTWIKPSFAWALYRSGYGKKPGQCRVLKIKLAHQSVAALLARCTLVDTNKDTRGTLALGDGDSSSSSGLAVGGGGRVQWDPERDLMQGTGREPRMLLRRRSIQIGLQGSLSREYVAAIVSVADVTELAHAVGAAHQHKTAAAQTAAMQQLAASGRLPIERAYLPLLCGREVLVRLGMLPGAAAETVGRLGKGRAAAPRAGEAQRR
eukprot:TRINITY_DN4970_c0_g1_i1.p1 TRINITY_DN4970_c0_g1~~TRINITY_DN4970_c0_g1_i1.p1  ORF type:complete len:360 (-),score=73.29 TRINITY_DN4970_c0_g1_i1:30-1055(-)